MLILFLNNRYNELCNMILPSTRVFWEYECTLLSNVYQILPNDYLIEMRLLRQEKIC